MIAAKDLMVGDWVMVTKCVADTHFIDYPDKIESIRDGLVGLESDGLETIIERIAPIPLTAYTLERNGFVKSYGVSDTPPYDKDEEGNMYYSFKGEHKFWGWWQPDNTYYIPANAMGDIVVKYVHQLQHAMRLVGIKKTIEL